MSSNHANYHPASAADNRPSPTMPQWTSVRHQDDPDKLALEAYREGHGARGTDPIPDDIAEKMKNASISNDDESQRPGVSRYDTDDYDDYPSTAPVATTSSSSAPDVKENTGFRDEERLVSPRGTNELELSPYADEHPRRSSCSVFGDDKDNTASGGVPLLTSTSVSQHDDNIKTTRREDPVFLASSAGKEFMDKSPVRARSPASAPAAVEVVEDPLDKHAAAEKGKKEGLLGKVAGIFGGPSEKEEREGEY